MPARLAWVSGAGPDFSGQQLNRYQIARAHSFNLNGDIDQTIGLHHGRHYSRPLRTGRSNCEDTIVSSEHTA
jgi:hypothetical protein